MGLAVRAGPGPIATEDARPTNREGQGSLRTVRRTIGDGIWRRRGHEVGKPPSRPRRRPRESDGTAARSLSAEVSTTGLRWDRCERRVWPDARGHRAGSPLIAAIRSSKPPGGAGACYNFLYCIEPDVDLGDGWVAGCCVWHTPQRGSATEPRVRANPCQSLRTFAHRHVGADTSRKDHLDLGPVGGVGLRPSRGLKSLSRWVGSHRVMRHLTQLTAGKAVPNLTAMSHPGGDAIVQDREEVPALRCGGIGASGRSCRLQLRADRFLAAGPKRRRTAAHPGGERAGCGSLGVPAAIEFPCSRHIRKLQHAVALDREAPSS